MECEKIVKLDLKYGLPFCDVNLCHNGKFISIKNVLLDTGSGGSVFKMDVVEDIGRVKNLLTKKFGVLNNDYNKKIEELDSENLNLIIDNILDIESVKDVEKFFEN